MDPYVQAALGRETPLAAARSLAAMRPERAGRMLLLSAVTAGAGACVGAYGIWSWLARGEAIFPFLFAGPVMVAASSGLGWYARSQARAPGAWFVATERALVLVRPHGARWVPWGALEGARATSSGDVVLTGRPHVRIEGPQTDTRCILDVVGASDPVGFARVCAERIAMAKPMSAMEAAKEQSTLAAWSVDG